MSASLHLAGYGRIGVSAVLAATSDVLLLSDRSIEISWLLVLISGALLVIPASGSSRTFGLVSLLIAAHGVLVWCLAGALRPLPGEEPVVTMCLWGLVLGVIAGARGLGWLLHRRHLRDLREHWPYCWRCAYDLTGNTSGICPECGTPLPRDWLDRPQIR